MIKYFVEWSSKSTDGEEFKMNKTLILAQAVMSAEKKKIIESYSWSINWENKSCRKY